MELKGQALFLVSPKIHPQKNFSNRKKFFSSLAFLPKKFFRFSNKKIGKSSALSVGIDQPMSLLTKLFSNRKKS
jgi:hypothetical protein